MVSFRNIVLSMICLLTLFPFQTQAFLSSISFFDIIELKFSQSWENSSASQPTSPPTPLVQGEGSISDDIYIETLTPEATLEIIDVQLPNDELLITLSGAESDINLGAFQLYMNGMLIDERLNKERYLSDMGKTTYKIKKNRIQNALFEWDNKIYFKHKKSGKNSDIFLYYYGDIVDYYRVREEVTCHGKIDNIVWRDAYGRVVYQNDDFQDNSFKLVRLNTNKRIRDGYHSYQVFCSDPIRDLYFVFDIGFEYQWYIERVSRESYFGRYVSQKRYETMQIEAKNK